MSSTVTTKDIDSRIARMNEELKLPAGYEVKRGGAYGYTMVDLMHDHCAITRIADGTKRIVYNALYDDRRKQLYAYAWSDLIGRLDDSDSFINATYKFDNVRVTIARKRIVVFVERGASYSVERRERHSDGRWLAATLIYVEDTQY